MKGTSVDEIYNKFDSWYKDYMEKEVDRLFTPYKETIKTMVKIGWLEGAYAQEEVRSKDADKTIRQEV